VGVGNANHDGLASADPTMQLLGAGD